MEPDLDGIPILFERWTALSDDSFFDADLDARVKARLEQGDAFDGICNVDGTRDSFGLRGPSYRESLVARASGSTGRIRTIAAMLSRAVSGNPFSSVVACCRELAARGSHVYLTETGGVLHRALQAGLGGLLTSSEYFGQEYRPGEMVDGRRHEDLQRLSFEDGRFDLVITMDVMEHVSNAPAAEREIVRILRPGGWYIFTIPFYFSLEHDRIRALAQPDGTIVHIEAPQYHGDPIRPETGALVFRDFAEADLRARFTALGCTFEIVRLWSPWLGILGSDMIVMMVRKTR